ncbi:ATP-dependent helicase HrpA [Xanthomonas translucens pv. graminis]|uniref:ATP-dependent helicase HrpA n=1 Tax=Xanthomonas graminis TaxID=3390026 RepID=UPI00253FFA58|nr:ATP-dependent helicase HrpA [Xanthomonas translucens]WIH03923.1 ATP-dependent helicase HrpA [Xanthomonas translucens pv. graminis]
MSFPFGALANANSASSAFRSFSNGIAGMGINTMAGMGENTIGAGQMGGTLANMQGDVANQEGMMRGVTRLQNELNFCVAECNLAKQAGQNVKSLTQG